MKKEQHLFSDTIIGIVLTVIILVLYLFPVAFFESLEYKLYDLRCKFRPSPASVKEIAIVGIDDPSINSIGRWPWARSTTSALVAQIRAAEPKVIGLNIIFSEPDDNQGLEEIQMLKAEYAALILTQTQKRGRLPSAFTDFMQVMSSAEARMDNDTIMANTLTEAGNVVLPMVFFPKPPLGKEYDELPLVLSSNTLPGIENPNDKSVTIMEVSAPTVPIELFSIPALGIGHINIMSDSDGAIRREVLLFKYFDRYYPSFALQIARGYMDIPLDQIKVRLGNKINLGRVEIPLDKTGAVLIDYIKPNNPTQQIIPYYSAFDVLSGKIPVDAFRNRIVLIGPMATGIADLHVTPLSQHLPGVEIVASIVYDILNQKYLVRAGWTFWAELALILVCGILVTVLLPRMKAKPAAIVTSAVFVVILGAGMYFFIFNGIWMKLFYATFLVVGGYIIITSKHFLITERREELVEAEGIETNKMLGLSFQGQGMLDMAFEKFRKCPVDDAMKEILYNLALDFERKRQFNKAAAVYDHIAAIDPKYKDIETKTKTLKSAGETVVFGAGFKKGSGEGTVLVEGAGASQVATPTLGRYEVVKELGHGAMGTVYLGKDPKINRMVAIKTIRFDDDIPEDQAKAIKERFFREAQSAGNLSHPNIIKIYDAGEDQDLSYIAMELLEGEDLKKYTEKTNILPPQRVLELLINVADALDYAHAQGVVHRDIKPANIMLLKDGSVRVTDFGIARISASSKTQTGAVLGTPSYMSPEQIAGKKVDGRSDLFSFGVMLYEMLTGNKPFQGDSIATLLFQITGEKHPNPKEINPNLSDCLIPVIDKILAKNPDERYQKGKEVVTDLKSCLEIVQKSGM